MIMSLRMQRLIRTFLLYLAVLALVISILTPFAWLIISSLASTRDLTTLPLSWIPPHASFTRYWEIMFGQTGETFRYGLRNSIAVASLSTLLSLIAGILAAYSLSRFPGRLRSSLLYVMLATYMMPPVALLLSLYILIRSLHLLNTIMGLSLVYCTFLTPFLTWILKGFFDSIPKELEEAAQVDGASRIRTLFLIVIPLAMPGIVAALLLGLLLAWDEFFYALIFTSTNASTTLPVAIASFTKRHAVDYGMMAAGGVVAALPPVLVAVFAQKHLISGLTKGGVKG